MIVSQLQQYIGKQLDFFSVSRVKLEEKEIQVALQRMNFCLSHIRSKYYTSNSFTIEEVHDTSKYGIFLYYLANTLFRFNKIELATKVFALNKMLHGFDIYYELELPEVFNMVHPVGTVLGRARYSNYFCVYQHCTVGGYHNGQDIDYPNFEGGGGIIMYCGATVIGKCNIGENVIFGANTFVINADIPSNSVVVGQYPNIRIMKNKISVINNFFKGE